MIKLFFYILPILSLFLPSLWVNYILKKNNTILPDMPFSGRELGKKILQEKHLDNVSIQQIKKIDHYNPIEKKVHIGEDKLDKKSITSIAVVAHEIGHAIQDKENYKPLLLRQKLIEKTIIFQRIGSFLLIIGLPSIFAITKSPFITFVAAILIMGCLSTNVVIHLITLPVEFDASRRALIWLKSANISTPQEVNFAEDALKWAASTYVVAALAAAAYLLYYVALLKE